MMAPSVFAAKAWRHFNYAGNGCEFVLDIIDGEVDLYIEIDALSGRSDGNDNEG